MLVNHTSRYHVAAAAVCGGAKHNARIRTDATELAARFMHMAQKDHEYIHQHGEGKSDLRPVVRCFYQCSSP